MRWRCIDTEPVTGGASCGDGQYGDDVTVRFLPVEGEEPDDGLHGVITETWYVENQHWQDADAAPEYVVMCRDEYLVCTDPEDPGMTEVRSDYLYGSLSYLKSHEDPDEAMASCLREAQRSIREHAATYGWDGRTLL